MKTICISALLGSLQAQLSCSDDRVKAAEAKKLTVNEEIKAAASL